MDPPIGIIAGGGRLPIASAQGIHATGRRVACVGLRDQYDADLPEFCDQFKTAGLIQLGRWISLLRSWGCSEVLMIGRVSKVQMYAPFVALRHRPDLRAGRIWFRTLRHDKRTDKLLNAVAEEIANEGITMIDSTTYIPELLAEAGPITTSKPSAGQLADIEFALPIVQRMGDLDVGQAVAVRDREIIAVEAIEGTDRMIERVGNLCRKGGWTLVKIAKPNQDMRFDVPTVGPLTIEKMAAKSGGCLAIEAGKTIILEKQATIAAADKAGIAIVGLEVEREK